jgi:hypothetical protein
VLARLARVFLAVALLAGWQSALQHPIEHVDELGELVHRHGGHSDEGAEPLCDLLAALTALNRFHRCLYRFVHPEGTASRRRAD